MDHFPELYRGYVGVGQPTNQCESEVLCWQELMRQSVVKRRFLDKILLKRYAPGKDVFMSNAYVYGVRNPMLGRDGIGIMHVKRHAMLSMAMMVIQSRCYTFMDKWYYLCGMQKSSVLYAEVVSRCYMPHGVLKIPVYFIHGKYDYLVSEKLARHYYEIVEAPAKDYVLFEHSAHSPLFEEADHFVDTVSSFLLGGNSGGRVV